MIAAILYPRAHSAAVIPTFLKITANSLNASAVGKPKAALHSLTIFVTDPALIPLSAAILSLFSTQPGLYH